MRCVCGVWVCDVWWGLFELCCVSRSRTLSEPSETDDQTRTPIVGMDMFSIVQQTLLLRCEFWCVGCVGSRMLVCEFVCGLGGSSCGRVGVGTAFV